MVKLAWSSLGHADKSSGQVRFRLVVLAFEEKNLTILKPRMGLMTFSFGIKEMISELLRP
jgi:hypothetical protein